MIDSKLFVFDIETVPDLELARSILHLEDEKDYKKIMQELAIYHNSDAEPEKVFFKSVFHKVVAISFGLIEINKNFVKINIVKNSYENYINYIKIILRNKNTNIQLINNLHYFSIDTHYYDVKKIYKKAELLI